MINVLDLVVAGLILFYLLRKAGSIARTILNLLTVFLLLILFGIAARVLLDLPLAEPIHKPLENSYFVKLSHYLIKLVYPAIEKGAPKVDVFIKEKIISSPTPEVTPKVIIPKKLFPKLTLPEMPELK